MNNNCPHGLGDCHNAINGRCMLGFTRADECVIRMWKYEPCGSIQ